VKELSTRLVRIDNTVLTGKRQDKSPPTSSTAGSKDWGRVRPGILAGEHGRSNI